MKGEDQRSGGGDAAIAGERVVLCNCADPAREAEFNAWYDAYAVDILWPRLLVNVRRYRRADDLPGNDGPRYLALYDIITDDLAAAWPVTRDHPTRPRRDRSPLLDTLLAATFERVAQWGRIGSERAEVVALFLDPSVAAEETGGLDALAAAMIDGGRCAGAWQSSNIEADRSQPQAMLVFEMGEARQRGELLAEAMTLIRARLTPAHGTLRYITAYRPVFSSGY